MSTMVLENNMNKDQAVREIKLGFCNNINSKINTVIKNYRGDLEAVFREAIDKKDIEAAGKYYSNLIVKGSPDFATTNQVQQDCIVEYGVYLLLLDMIDSGKWIPQSILDDSLVIRINNAAQAMGYTEPAYPMEFDEKGCVKIDRNKKCISASYNHDFGTLDAETKAAFEKQIKDINEYLASKNEGQIIMTASAAPEKEEKQTEETKTEEPKAESKTEEVKTEEPKTEETKTEEPKAEKKSPRSENKKEEPTSLAPVEKVEDATTLPPETPKAPVITPDQQVYVGYNPLSGEPAHVEPFPTAPAPEKKENEPAPTAPVNSDAFDVEAYFASLISPEKFEMLKNVDLKATPEEIMNRMNTEEAKKAINNVVDLLIGADEQKEGAKSSPRK